jgi:UDP-2,4-diacetamido-2,4,6-trideoxy-beta-L-altropyranose hydrolase
MNHLIIRADATPQIGTGHVMRCLALAEAWRDEGGEAVFICHYGSDAIEKRIRQKGFDILPLPHVYPHPSDINCVIGVINRYRTLSPAPKIWVAIDGYGFDAAYQEYVKKKTGCELLCIDDYGHASHYYADLVVNQNVSSKSELYIGKTTDSRLLLGARYVMLRNEFLCGSVKQRENPPVGRKILVSMGGGDTSHVILKVLSGLKRLAMEGVEVRIIIGPENSHISALEEEINGESVYKLLANVTNMQELMMWADLVITAGGTTSWEAAYMGLPQVVTYFADNQKSNAKALDEKKIGINLGYHQYLTAETIAEKLKEIMMDQERRSLMSQRGQTLIDGLGRQRICKIMLGKRLRIRPISQDDCEILWKWANDPTVRAVSFVQEPIAWEDHVQWFQQRKDHPFFHIALDEDNRPIGQVRIDPTTGKDVVISLSIDKNFRNSGYGAELIGLACEKKVMESGEVTIHAYIKPENEASKTAFTRAGFKDMGLDASGNHPACHFIFSNFINGDQADSN